MFTFCIRKFVLGFCIVNTLVLFQTSVAASTQDTHTPSKSLKVHLKKDNLLSIINPKNKKSDEAKAALKVYYDKAIPFAQSYGYKNIGALTVAETLVGEDQPGTFVLAKLPSEEADVAFESHPDWQQYKVMRPIIWKELNFYKAPVQKETTLHFFENKFYTIAFAWLDQAHPKDYQKYMKGIAPSVEAVGGRFIHTMKNPRYVSHTDQQPGPDQITFVEWDSLQAFDKFGTSEGFKQHAKYLNSGTSQFKLYQIKPIIR